MQKIVVALFVVVVLFLGSFKQVLAQVPWWLFDATPPTSLDITFSRNYSSGDGSVSFPWQFTPSTQPLRITYFTCKDYYTGCKNTVITGPNISTTIQYPPPQYNSNLELNERTSNQQVNLGAITSGSNLTVTTVSTDFVDRPLTKQFFLQSCQESQQPPICRTTSGQVPNGQCGYTPYAANCPTSCGGSGNATCAVSVGPSPEAPRCDADRIWSWQNERPMTEPGLGQGWWVDWSDNANFKVDPNADPNDGTKPGRYYHKWVSTPPGGPGGWVTTSIPSDISLNEFNPFVGGAITIIPGRMYYLRVYNGAASDTVFYDMQRCPPDVTLTMWYGANERITEVNVLAGNPASLDWTNPPRDLENITPANCVASITSTPLGYSANPPWNGNLVAILGNPPANPPLSIGNFPTGPQSMTFSLTCSRPSEADGSQPVYAPVTSSVKANINIPATIQTQGGNVHSNEDINVTPGQ